MAYIYQEFENKVSEIVHDDAEKLTITERRNFIQEAVKIYSRHRPREVIKEITGDGSAYDFAISSNLTYWIKDFSVIKSIEYPADERSPEYIDENDWMIIEKEAGQYIRLLEDTPLATEKMRVIYTALQILNDTASTIPEIDEDALANLAASFCSGALASIYAHAIDSTITADSVDHKSKSEQFAARARIQKQNYLNHLGIKEGASETPPASVVKDLDQDYPWGEDRLTHPKRWR